jgi:hypothetical protein
MNQKKREAIVFNSLGEMFFVRCVFEERVHNNPEVATSPGSLLHRKS